MDVTFQTGHASLRALDFEHAAANGKVGDAGVAAEPGSAATRVAPVAGADGTQLAPKRSRRDDNEAAERGGGPEAGADVARESVAQDPGADLAAGRFRYKVAYAPDLERTMVTLVDEETEQTVMSLPPESLVRMLNEAEARLEGTADGDGTKARQLDTAV